MRTKNIAMILTLALTAGFCQTAAPSQAATPKLSTKKLTMKVGKTAALKVKKTSKKAKWSIVSGKKNIRLTAKKKTSVKVKAVKAGKAKISCKIGKKKLVCKVTVYGLIPPCVMPTQSPTMTASETPTATVEPTSTPTQTPEVTKVPVRTHEPTENRIMAEPAKYTELPSEDENGLPISRYYTNKRYYFFGTDVLRKDIEELTFSSSDKVPEEAVQSFDLSEKQNKSVMAWYTDKDKNGLYEMTIGQDKGVVANSNSAYLCCDVGQVDGIENLYTTGVKDMSYMFFQYRADAPSEKAVLDLGDNFDTSAVENMDGMFWYTSHMFSAITLRLGKAFQFDNVKSSVLAFQLGESSNNKILVSKLEQKNFIIAPEHNCVVDEAGFEKYIIVE
ncbi:MAG: hypothetical protein J6B84_03000 [Eubacterium sp.]|nr:hypothetical protein [Eubacterium sp.]